MKIQNISKTIAGSLLGIALIFGVVVVSSVTANGQYGRTVRNWDGYPNWGGSFQLRQTALNAGYNEGSKEGRNDRARGRSRNYQDFNAFNKATKDYSSRLGDRELYRRYFQRAFASGYDTEMGINRNYDNFPNFPNNFPNNNPNTFPNTYPNNYPGYNPNRVRRGRSWDGYPNWGGTFQLRQTALNAGYNEGHKMGKNDRGRGRFTDYRNSNVYQKSTKDYSSRLGDRELYRRYFREAFENGYADGYDGY